jgi:DNA-binding NtrC family response regulator
VFNGEQSINGFRCIDFAEAFSDTDCWMEAVRAAFRDPDAKVLFLPHLDLLDFCTSDALRVLIEQQALGIGQPRIVTTLTTSHDVKSSVNQRLLTSVNVAQVLVPPLRHHVADIPEIAKALLAKHTKDRSVRFSRSAMAALTRAPWFGNVRELENVIRGLVSLRVVGDISIEQLPLAIRSICANRVLTKMEQVEFEAILDTLRVTRGNRAEAAQVLGISRSTLYRKLHTYGLDAEDNFLAPLAV